jgi:hypothetical protein
VTRGVKPLTEKLSQESSSSLMVSKNSATFFYGCGRIIDEKVSEILKEVE